MKNLLALLALISLQGCASIFGPDDWEPNGHLYVGGWSSDPFAVVHGRYAQNFSGGGAHLYRPDPNEKPRIEQVEVQKGVFVSAEVWANKCIAGMEPKTIIMGTANAIYLCGNRSKQAKAHEVAHVKGMRHTEWINTGVARCATITESGFESGYKAGDEICVANGHEWVEAKRK